MAESAEAQVGSSTRRKGVVFMGDAFIELEDPAAVTLEDLCDAFDLAWESGMHVRQRTTGRVVATLPFEPLPSLNEVVDRAESLTDAVTGVSMLAGAPITVGNEEEEEMEDVEAAPYAVVYDLVSAAVPELDEAAAALAGPLTANIRGLAGIEETMRQLVQLGAANLLNAEPASVIQGKREYNPAEAPGLLRRILYGATQYSPYRGERDPLTDGRHALFRTTGGGTASASPTTAGAVGAFAGEFIGEGGPYLSYLDSYAFQAEMELPRPTAGPLRSKAAIVVPLTNEERQRIFGYL